ncbi:hypothetical protein GH733_001799 [Mirounga leonina]|nr:hypothetical protein GH733_001799 [Mirounga leonina]
MLGSRRQREECWKYELFNEFALVHRELSQCRTWILPDLPVMQTWALERERYPPNPLEQQLLFRLPKTASLDGLLEALRVEGGKGYLSDNGQREWQCRRAEIIQNYLLANPTKKAEEILNAILALREWVKDTCSCPAPPAWGWMWCISRQLDLKLQ